MGATGRAAGTGLLRPRRRAAPGDRPGDVRVPPGRAAPAGRRGNARRGLAALIETADRYGEYARAVLIQGARLRRRDGARGRPTALQLIDLAMTRGYNWKRGPFAHDAPSRSPAERSPPTAGRRVAAARRPAVSCCSPDLRRREARPFEHNASASLWDAGDGVACLEFHTKANAIDDDVLEVIERTVAAAGERYRALVIYNEGRSSGPAATSATSADARQRGRLGSAGPRSACAARGPSTASSTRRCR